MILVECIRESTTSQNVARTSVGAVEVVQDKVYVLFLCRFNYF